MLVVNLLLFVMLIAPVVICSRVSSQVSLDIGRDTDDQIALEMEEGRDDDGLLVETAKKRKREEDEEDEAHTEGGRKGGAATKANASQLAPRRSRTQLSGQLQQVTHLKATKVMLFTDPGPDPDDLKALIWACWKTAISTKDRNPMQLVGVVATGGSDHGLLRRGQPHDRAALAFETLNRIGAAKSVPVAIGSPYPDQKPTTNEQFAIPTAQWPAYAKRNFQTAETLFRRIVGNLRRGDVLALEVNAGFTDVARLAKAPATAKLFKSRVKIISVQGALVPGTAAGYNLQMDPASANCGFDIDAANFVLDFCVKNNIQLRFMHKDSIPNLPMTVAKQYAQLDRIGRQPVNPAAKQLFVYLNNKQTSGLQVLWQNNVCTGKLDGTAGKNFREKGKEWFVTIFCGNTPAARSAMLGSQCPPNTPQCFNFDVGPYLAGTVKPYDPTAAMTLTDLYDNNFNSRAQKLQIVGQGYTAEALQWMNSQQVIPLEHVQSQLEAAFSWALTHR